MPAGDAGPRLLGWWRALGPLTVLAFAAGLPYLLRGVDWLREDWGFASGAHLGGLSDAHAWFFPFRPVAGLVHLAIFLPGTSPTVVFLVQTVLVALVGWLLVEVGREWLGDGSLWLGIVWVVLPIHTAMSWWASALYITVALALVLQGMRIARPSGALWVLVGAFCYAAAALPMAALLAWQRRWWHVAAAATGALFELLTNPITGGYGPLSATKAIGGTFGLGLGVAAGAAVLLLGLLSAWRRDDVRPLLAVGLGAVALIPFVNYGEQATFVAQGDRVNVVAAIAVAVLVVTVCQRRLLRLGVVVLLLGLSWSRALDFARAVELEHQAIRCAQRHGDTVVIAKVSYHGVGALTDTWDSDPAVRLLFDDAGLHASLTGTLTCGG